MYLDKNGLNVIIKVSRNAKGIEGTSNLMKADREQPAGERRLREPCEYLPELCTETSGSDFSENSRLQRFGIR